MNTIPDPSRQAASFQQAASATNARARSSSRNLRHLWRLRRLQVTLLRPFRKALRPLLVWLRQDHIYMTSGHHGSAPAGVRLREFGWETIAVSIVLAPLVFILLLPLLILILPAVVIVGLAGVIIASMETDDDAAVHHSLAWHAMH